MKTIASIAVFAAAAYAQTTPPTSKFKINCQTNTSPDGEAGPAFTAVQQRDDGEYNVYWSSFARKYGGVSASGAYGETPSHSFCDTYDNSSYTALVQANVFNWPNEVEAVPTSVFGGLGYMTVADGFATPATHDGCVAIVNTNGPMPAQEGDIQFLTNGCGQGNLLQTKYYYHYTRWFDMDGDGDLDLLTARCSSLTDPTQCDESQLLWLQNPGKAFSPTSRTWKQFIVDAAANIADVGLDVMEYNGQIYVIAGGFTTGKLLLLSGQNWANTANIQAVEIANNNTYYFAQRFGDLNADGIPDVFVTIGSYGQAPGKLIVYPGVDNGAYSLGDAITVYDQFPVFNSAGLGSPGDAQVFYYSSNTTNTIPSILISGDDDGMMYMADPSTTDPSSFNWQYTTSVIMKTKQFSPFVTPFNAPTVGDMTVVDINGDGCTDIVVAAYSLKQIVFLEQKNTRSCVSN